MNVRFTAFLLFLSAIVFAQNNECKLKIGTNLAGISDWMTEMPFVDMMHNARTWGTRNLTWIEGGVNEWNTELTNYIEKDENGYPLEVPFYQNGLELEDSQMIFTVWASIDAWEPGIYTFLYDGEGEFDFNADGRIIANEPGRAEVQIIPSDHSFLELVITRSKKGNHLRNFRLIMPGQEVTYQEQPFNPLYLERLQHFAAIRFMDWGNTNNWGEEYSWLNYDEPEDTILVPWSERSTMGYYTWAHNKGVPYEMMCDLCNTLNKDMWVCVPHNASNEYIAEMASLIKNRLNPGLKIYAEYSNEIWNWMFGQTQWLFTFFCEGRGMDWPEGIVSNVQRNLDVWNDVFQDDMDRLVTVVGGQTAWQDVTNRIVLNLDKGTYDALNITGYFGLSEEGDAALDELGSSATAADVAHWVRKNMYETEITYIENQYELAKQLNIPVVFYEAGQHITPHPFGEEPAYSQAILNVQRDTSMYNLYMEWFRLIEDVFDEGEESLFMHFSFVSALSAQYGSWGILETLDQDTSQIYAPKFHAVMEKINACENTGSSVDIFKNPVPVIKILSAPGNRFTIKSEKPFKTIRIYNPNGQCIKKTDVNLTSCSFQLTDRAKGVYIVEIQTENSRAVQKVWVE
ncbi:MAG: T9SS type A sorting domain-containing protein [Prolixibacteraceae bacterium]|nr:T9SS type A sorting domain-containing protein [Prolixibacteraceae bacterium]